MKKLAVIFDMDGVLVDNNKYHELAWIEFCKLYNFNIDTKEISRRFGNTNSEYFTFLFGKELSKDESDKLGEEKEALYRKIYKQYISPANGLLPLLDQLKSNDIKMAVATSAPKSNLDFVIDELKIRHYFDVLVDASMVLHGKPNPEVFLKAASLLQVSSDQCIVFEDSVHGINAAINARMTVVALTTSFPQEMIKQANKIINSFSEITFKDIKELLN